MTWWEMAGFTFGVMMLGIGFALGVLTEVWRRQERRDRVR